MEPQRLEPCWCRTIYPKADCMQQRTGSITGRQRSSISHLPYSCCGNAEMLDEDSSEKI